MTPDQLETVVARTGHTRYRLLTSDDNPDARQREGYRRVVEQMASGEPPQPPAYPSIVEQARNLAGAAVRFVGSGLAIVDQAEFDRRRGICRACPTNHYDADRDACRACGCHLAVKPWGKAEDCPKGYW